MIMGDRYLTAPNSLIQPSLRLLSNRWNYDAYKTLRTFDSFNKSLDFNEDEIVLVFNKRDLEGSYTSWNNFLHDTNRYFNKTIELWKTIDVQLSNKTTDWYPSIIYKVDKIAFLDTWDYRDLIAQEADGPRNAESM